MKIPDQYKLQYRAILFIALFIGLYTASVLINFHLPQLNNEEPRRAVITLEMLHSGNYFSPTLLGWPYYNKPPVYNWLMGALFKLTGSSSEAVVRTFSFLCLLVWAILHFIISRKYVSVFVAALSSIFLVTCADIYFYGLQNGGEIDIFYALIVYLQVISLFYFGEKKQWLSFYIYSYLFCAIGFLTKGYPSLVFQLFTLLVIAVQFRSVRVLLQWQHWLGLLVWAVITGGYLYIYSLENSVRIFLVNLLNESFKKTTIGGYSENWFVKIITYPFLFIKFLLPWSLLLLLLFRKIRISFWKNPLLHFSVLFILFNISIYWLTGKPKLRYAYMFVPFCFTLLAFLYEKFQQQQPHYLQRVLKPFGYLFISCAALIMGSLFFFPLPIFWSIGLSVLFLVLAYYYFKWQEQRIWIFALAVILARLAYATLFLPVQQDKLSIKYDQVLQEIIHANPNKELTFWSPPFPMPVEVNLKFKRWPVDSVVLPPEIAYQVPYYYYQQTGRLMQYDTLMKQQTSYITYHNWLSERNKDITILWEGPKNDNSRLILFTRKPSVVTKD